MPSSSSSEQELEGKAMDRFRHIYNALNESSLESTQFRNEMRLAYGFKNEYSLDPKETAKKEREFAENCLSGRGSDTNQMAYDHGDLRTVLAIEIGIFPAERGADGEPLKRRQWFGGDWIKMAHLIIENSEAASNKPVDRRTQPADVIRLWPIKAGSIASRTSIHSTNLYKTSLVLDQSGKDSDTIYLLYEDPANKHEHFDGHKWISLPVAPNKLYQISNVQLKKESGIPENLWSSFPLFFEGAA
jgi:hypothetical protein